MKFRSLVAAAAALTLTTSPVLAADARALAPISGESDAWNSDGTLVGIVALIALIIGGVLLATNDDDTPNSP